MSIVYKNSITADEVNAIRKSMGWRQIHHEQQQANIDGNTLTIAAYKSETAVAMAGLRWNGGSRTAGKQIKGRLLSVWVFFGRKAGRFCFAHRYKQRCV